MGTCDTIGGTPRHNPSFDMDPPCEVCGKPVDECQCEPCPQCGALGCPLHGVKITPYRKKKRKHKMRKLSGNWRSYD